MGLNLETLFLRAVNQQDVAQRACDILAHIAVDQLQFPDWRGPASVSRHPVPRRKVAVSPAMQGWLQVVTSDEVVEPRLAIDLSVDLATDVVAIQVYEVTGASGYTHCLRGRILHSEWDEHAIDPLGAIRGELSRLTIPGTPTTFAEALRAKGWLIAAVTASGAA